MQTDRLGPSYECQTIDLGGDDEGPVVATLVRRRAPGSTGRAVLWVHGWSDYFFQDHVAAHFTARGYDFYALDLRKYGRSLGEHQTPGFCRSVTEYFPELDEAVRRIRFQDGHHTLVLAAHSTGGLSTAIWAHVRRAARPVDALVLNSPFFDVNLPGWLRAPSVPLVSSIGRRRPYAAILRPSYAVYGESLHRALRGEWDYDRRWKPIGGFPVRYGWVAAIRAAQRRLHAGLAIDVPVLVACATRSLRTVRWREDARYADTVLNVDDIVRWAPWLGRRVSVLRVEGGMHDLTLSAEPAREAFFRDLDRWLDAYATGRPSDGDAPRGDAPHGNAPETTAR